MKIAHTCTTCKLSYTTKIILVTHENVTHQTFTVTHIKRIIGHLYGVTKTLSCQTTKH